jgi:NAD+ synthase
MTDSDYGQLADQIAAWLRQQLDFAGGDGFVLGLSGGVDSAVVCGLCCRAAGPERVLGAIMPSHSNPRDEADADLVAETFGVETVRVDLTPVTDAFLRAMPSLDPEGTAGEWRVPEQRGRLALANVKPRLRMTALYYLANLRNRLVVGTGNKSEAMIGYFTKYGDGGVDLLPIVDLYNHEVRALARVLGVPEPVIAKPPSAGLWPGQTDEGEIGITYDELDATLAAIVRGATDGIPPERLARVEQMIRASEHKRQPAPAFRRAAAAVGEERGARSEERG